MKKHRIMLAGAALMLAIALLAAGALAGGTLASVTDAAEALLLDTHNVTITGSATFKLDGERFKTAEITYVQDGTDSFWQEKLSTPRYLRPDRETGFTVIANGYEVYVMEPFTPGGYKEGYITEQDTVLRDSLEARLLMSLAGTAASVAEPALHPEQKDGEIRITVAEGETPPILNELLLMAGRFAGKRLFGYGFDGPVIDHSYWGLTETQEIFLQTEACRVLTANVSFRLDGKGRLAGAEGAAGVALVYVNGEEHRLDLDFSLTAGEYGTSKVKAFDPDDFQVVPMDQARERNEAAAREKAMTVMAERAREAWKAAGFEGAERLETEFWAMSDGLFGIGMKDPQDPNSNETTVRILFDPTDTIFDVRDRMDHAVEAARATEDGDFVIRLASAVLKVPGFATVLVALVKLLDRYGLLPGFLVRELPFYSGLFITNNGSIGLPGPFHHIYNFGDVSLFMGMGGIQKEAFVEPDGKTRMRRWMPMGITADERVCSGAHYAAFFADVMHLIASPEDLEVPPENVKYDKKAEYHVPKVEKTGSK